MADTVRRGGKKGRKHGRQKRSAAFKRYWSAYGGLGRRYARKIRNLMRCNGLTKQQAIQRWSAQTGKIGYNI